MTQGHWLVHHDLENAIMTRPPLHTWLMALFSALFGLNRLSLALPSFLSVLALGLIVFEAGRRRFGELAGGLAAIAIVLAPTMAKQVALVDSEPVFTLSVTIAALAAFSAWERGKDGKKGWLLFWFMAALVTLAFVAPLALLLWRAIDNAELRGTTASVTVRFVSDQVNLTTARDGSIATGAEAVVELTDLWTFQREIGSTDPTWKLVATGAA